MNENELDHGALVTVAAEPNNPPSREQLLEKYRRISNRLSHNERLVKNDGHITEFADFVKFCRETRGATLDSLLGEGFASAVRRHLAQSQEDPPPPQSADAQPKH